MNPETYEKAIASPYAAQWFPAIKRCLKTLVVEMAKQDAVKGYAKGSEQEFDIDFTGTFLAVVRCGFAHQDLEMKSFDVRQYFYTVPWSMSHLWKYHWA